MRLGSFGSVMFSIVILAPCFATAQNDLRKPAGKE
jgi:hypothetical protein